MGRIRQHKTVSVSLRVRAEIVDGEVTEAQMAEWVTQAVSHYFTFRGGYVGYKADAGIRLPKVAVIHEKEGEDSSPGEEEKVPLGASRVRRRVRDKS